MRAPAFSIAMVICCSAAAAAQSGDSPLGSRLGNRTEAGPAEQGRDAIRAAHGFARCIYFARAKAVRRWLTTVDPKEFDKTRGELFGPIDCDPIQFADSRIDSLSVGTSISTSRGTLAEAALLKEGSLTKRVGTLPALPIADGYNRPWFALTGRSPAVNAMSACFADTQPALIVDLLNTPPASDQEKAVIGRIASLLGPCLIGGASLKANAFALRTSLADAYFQRIHAVSTSAGVQR